MLTKLFANGGRKLWLVAATITVAIVNELVGLGVSPETIKACLLAAVGGSGTIALEDGLKALFRVKEAPRSSLDDVIDTMAKNLVDAEEEDDEDDE